MVMPRGTKWDPDEFFLKRNDIVPTLGMLYRKGREYLRGGWKYRNGNRIDNKIFVCDGHIGHQTL